MLLKMRVFGHRHVYISVFPHIFTYIYAVYFQGDKEHAICPVMLGDARLAATFADKMLSEFFYMYTGIIILYAMKFYQ